MIRFVNLLIVLNEKIS